jgi:Fe-S-cluster containining protein
MADAATVTNGCSGVCCSAFRIPRSLDELRALGENGNEEAGQIADMVIPLTPDEARARNIEFGGEPNFADEDAGLHYACRNWDEETRLCTIYDERPEMCRAFPYGEPCAFGCSCVGHSVNEGS